METYLRHRCEQTLARLDTKASRRTLSALAIPSSLRSSLRLKANQKTGSTAQVPLPFSLARPLPRSPLRSADGHRNRDAIVPRYLHISAFPIGNRYSVADSVRSLQLPSAPPRKRIRFYGSVFLFMRGGDERDVSPVGHATHAATLHAIGRTG